MGGPYDQILLFGDSITQFSSDISGGFALQPALQDLFIRRFDIINRGFSGYNTANALHVLPQFMPTPEQARIRLLYVFFGANDSVVPEYPSKQHVPLNQYKANLKAIVNHPAVAAHKPKVLFIIPPPVDEAKLEESGFEPNGRFAKITAGYAEGCREVARELGAAYCDLWTVFMKHAVNGGDIPELLPGDKKAPRNDKLRDLLADGLHFTTKAYKLMFGAVKESILENFPEFDPKSTTAVFPLWGEAPSTNAEI